MDNFPVFFLPHVDHVFSWKVTECEILESELPKKNTKKWKWIWLSVSFFFQKWRAKKNKPKQSKEKTNKSSCDAATADYSSAEMEQRNRSGIAPLADSTCKGPHKSTLTDEVGGSRRRPLLLLRPFQSAGDLSTGSVRFNFFMQPRENRHQLWKWFILIYFHLKMILFILLVSSIQRSQLTHRLFAGQEIWIFKWNHFHWNQDTGIYYWKNFRHIRMI